MVKPVVIYTIDFKSPSKVSIKLSIAAAVVITMHTVPIAI